MGNEVHARPHTHAPVSIDVLPDGGVYNQIDPLSVFHDHEHEESTLCYLDIDALLGLLLTLDAALSSQLVQHTRLISTLEPVYLLVSTVCLAVPIPPPTS